MTNFERLNGALAAAAKRQNQYQFECARFIDHLTQTLFGFLGAPPQTVGLTTMDDIYGKKPKHTEGAVSWDDAGYCRVRLVVRVPSGVFSFPLALKIVAGVVEIVLGNPGEPRAVSYRVEVTSSSGLHEMFSSWVDESEADLSTRHDRWLAGGRASRNDIGFKFD